MSSEKLTNKTPSDGASAIFPARTPQTEVEYLRREATEARTALVCVALELPRVIERNPTFRSWTEEHPFLTTGSAAGIGFLVGTLFTPRQHNGAGAIKVEHASGTTQPDGFKAMLRSLVSQRLVKIVQTALVSLFLTERVAGKGMTGDGDQPTETRPGPTG